MPPPVPGSCSCTPSVAGKKYVRHHAPSESPQSHAPPPPPPPPPPPAPRRPRVAARSSASLAAVRSVPSEWACGFRERCSCERYWSHLPLRNRASGERTSVLGNTPLLRTKHHSVFKTLLKVGIGALRTYLGRPLKIKVNSPASCSPKVDTLVQKFGRSKFGGKSRFPFPAAFRLISPVIHTPCREGCGDRQQLTVVVFLHTRDPSLQKGCGELLVL